MYIFSEKLCAFPVMSMSNVDKSNKRTQQDVPGPSMPDGLEMVIIEPDGNAKEIFGFQLSGNRTMGVYVRGILGGTTAEKNGKLEVGDQLVQVDDMNLAGMTTDQVARVIRLSLELHGATKLTVAHKSARSKGHAWRPSTPLATSFSDSNLAHEMASKNRKASQVHEAEVHSPKDPFHGNKHSGPPRSTTHDALMMISEMEEDTMTSPAEDTESTFLPEDYHAPLPNIPPLEEDRVSFRRTGKITPTASISAKNNPPPDDSEKRVVFGPKKNYGADIRHSRSNGDMRDDNFLVVTHRKLSTPAPGENIKDFLNSSQRRSFIRKEMISNEEVPLVCFDQLNKSYTDETGHDKPLIKRTESQSSQSSSSNKSNKSSSESQHLAWQCPVCFDGANRVSKTKRRLMSTACGHVFCSRCVADILRQQKVCPTCRKAVRPTEIHPIFM